MHQAPLEALTEGLSKEVAAFGIKVCAIEPGAFQTDYLKRSLHRADNLADYAEIAERKDLIVAFADALPGDPAKLAAVVLELAAFDDPPLRLLLGKDVLQAFREKTAAWTEVVDEWEHVPLPWISIGPEPKFPGAASARSEGEGGADQCLAERP